MADTVGDRFNLGLETAGKIFARSPVMPSFEVPAEIAGDWTGFSVSTVMADIWSRPGLELSQRALVAIAGLTALNRPDQLRAYVHGALSLGVTRAEVCEVIFQMAGYAGFPAAIDAFGIASRVFAEADAGTPEA